MENIIREKLAEIEEERDVTILYAVESGSRAWGFASVDSDYDVRFIYARKKEEYLRLEPSDDVIDLPLKGNLDISGWDLSKALRLLYKSNPSIFEWLNSPVFYKTVLEFARFRRLSSRYFSPKKMIFHYLGIARQNFQKYMDGMDEVSLKKYFYIMRGILGSRWIMKNSAPPPIVFSGLAESLNDEKVRTKILSMIEEKRNAKEELSIARVPVLDEFINRQIDEITDYAEKLEERESPGWGPLNDFFLDMIEENRFLFC